MSGCVTPTQPNSGLYISTNNQVYNADIIENMSLLKLGGKRVFYVGLALWGGEKWSEGDVETISLVISELYPERRMIPFVFSNKETNLPTSYHSFNAEMIKKVSTFISKRIQPNDILWIFISSHGEKNLVVNRVGNRKGEALNGEEINGFISKFKNVQKVIVISSCYSGSLIEKINDSKSIIMTAASKDRSSFGCSPSNSNTWFVNSMREAISSIKSSNSNLLLSKIFEQTKNRVLINEKKLVGESSSNPQIFIGDKVNETVLHY